MIRAKRRHHVFIKRNTIIYTRKRKKSRVPLSIRFRRLFASRQIPIGKILAGYRQVAMLESSGIVLFACLLKIHPFELLEVSSKRALGKHPKRGKLATGDYSRGGNQRTPASRNEEAGIDFNSLLYACTTLMR